jgi:predicted NUDIX family NTP pyrophosphohydrolase
MVWYPLGDITQKSGKVVHAWAFENTTPIDPVSLRSNQIQIEHPQRSHQFISIPEVDKGAFFPINIAEIKINSAQVPFLRRLMGRLNS